MQDVKSAKEKEDKDDKYKSDKTGQYVSKDVQVTGYEDGSERPTRPKFDAAAGSIGTLDMVIDPGDGGGGGTYTPPTITPVSSVGIGGTGVIYDLKIRKGHDSSINTSDLPGYYKIPVDLNKGAGGRYIYLCFTRDSEKVQGSSGFPNPWVNSYQMGRDVPVRGIHVESKLTGPAPQFFPEYIVPIEAKDDLGGFYQPDLNDGAGGKYIYAYQVKGAERTEVVKEVGVIYGTSSSIQPPSDWKKIPVDLNEGAGGDYVYFCVKYL